MNGQWNTRCLCLLGLVLGLAWPGPRSAAAPSPDAVTAFFQSRNALPKPPLGLGPLPDAQQNPSNYLGRIFELTAQVGGLVTVAGEQTVLLSVSTSSLSAWLPPGVAASRDLDSGQTVRVLVQVERQGNELSLANLRLLAVAPEADVAAAERRLAASAQARVAAASPRGPSERVAGVGLPVPAAPTPSAGLSPRAQGIYGPYWNAVRRLNRRLSSANVDKITYSVLFYSDQYDIDPRLVVAMVIAESDFDIHSTSRTGAMGLGQLMPATARGLGVKDPYDPVQNIAAAVHILRGHLDKYGGAPWGAGIIPDKQIALTMAAYNAGPGAVRKYHGVPPYKETRRYVARVTALYKQMCGVKG